MNQKYWVDGVEFFVYEARVCAAGEAPEATYEGQGYCKATTTPIASGKTENGGIYNSILLKPGTYIVEETAESIKGVDIVELPKNAADRICVIKVEPGANPDDGSDHTFNNPAAYGKFVLKKVDQDGKAIAATFQLYRKVEPEEPTGEATWELVDTITTPTTGDGIYESGFLAPGKYKLVETNATGYTIAYGEDNPVEFEIKPGEITGSTGQKAGGTAIKAGDIPEIKYNADFDEPILLANNEQGSISLLKVGTFMGDVIDANLQGVNFALYKYTGSDNTFAENYEPNDTALADDFTLVLEKTTGNDGKIAWNNLDTGWYYLVETGIKSQSEADGKYEVNSANHRMVFLDSGNSINYTDVNSCFKNDTTYGKFQIKKVDANSRDGLSGVVFDIYTSEECDSASRATDINGAPASITTGNDGIGTSPLLPAGEYFLKEKTAPAGYVYDDEDGVTGPYTVTANDIKDYSSDPITNTKLFSIFAIKQESITHTPLAGAVIGLYTNFNAAQAGSTSVDDGFVESKPTDSNGSVRFTDLKFDADGEATYYIRELQAPADHKLNDTVYTVNVNYNENETEFTFTENSGVIYNDLLGNVRIHKQGSWQSINDQAKTAVDLEGVGFSLYKVDKAGDTHTEGAVADATMTTDSQGIATSKRLPAGWYELVETVVPEEYTQAESYWVQISDNGTTETLYNANGIDLGSNIITNIPVKGNFTLYKYDGDENRTQDGLTELSDAVFRLEKKNADGDWVPVNPNNPTFTMASHDGGSSYTSAYLDPGDYRITEVTAPTYSYTSGDGIKHTIHFSLLDKPMEFKIEAGVTCRLNAYNSPQGSITLTKYGVDSLFDITSGEQEPLEGATFRLYYDENCTKEVTWDILDEDGNYVRTEDSLRTTGTDGKIEKPWSDLDPGTYWIKETAEGESAVNDQGYGINPEPKSVTIEAGALVSEVQRGELDKSVNFYNETNAGRIRILKVDNGGVPQKLAGAEFAIYSWNDEQGDWNTAPVQTLTITNANEGVVSGFLPAQKDGTQYKIVETKAPEDYTLDGELSDLEQVVTVYPEHDPDNALTGGKNCFVFANRTQDSVKGMNGDIHKQIREAGNSDDETGFKDETVTANESLLISDYTLEYKLDGYGDGSNEKPIEDLTVTDNNIVLYSAKQLNDGTSEYTPMTRQDRDYTINSVTALASHNADANEKVGAVIYAQYTMDEKAYGTWHQVQVLEDISSDQTVIFSKRVVGVKVEYTNTLKGFESNGLILNVTFDQRGDWSTENDPEVRQITNDAQISWKDVYLDESGQVQTTNVYTENSNTVTAQLPSYENKLPEVELTTEITDNKTTFYSGDEINFRVTAENMSVDDDEKIFHQPVISFKLPAQTVLDETSWTNGFLVYKVSKDGTRTVIPSSLYTITETETSAAEHYLGGDNYVESDTLMTTQYALEFAQSESTQLAPGDQLVIEFSGYVSYERKTGFDLVIPGYLSSSAKIPVSAENPKGMSFIPYDQQFYDNDITDGLVNDDLSYIHSTDTVYVNNTTAVRLLKEIGTMEADGTIHWYNRGEVASVNPSDEIYYRLTLYNYSAEYVETAKLVDIFPCENDTYVLTSSETRGTDIPFGEGYENMELLDATAGAGGTVTWYSTTHDWSTRSSDEQDTILQPMYYKVSDWSYEWSEGISSNATALGMEIDLTNSGTTQGLEPNGSYEIIIAMKTPGYTADKMDEYYGKFMDNSAAAAVVKAGTSDQVDRIYEQDQVEPNKVRATMDLPTGSIGDYVWFDKDLDGIQDADEEPAEGMNVELWQTRYYEFNGSVRQDTQRIAVTQTDQDGKYLFTGLACEYLNGNAAEGSQDPSDYVGGEYYTYQVKFITDGKYEGYTFTQQYAGNDQAADSDADVNGETGSISLSVISNADGSLSGENNMTLDAGITGSYALGDYVWLDTNCNGVQDDTESGVQGVPVFLYKVDGPDGQVQDGQAYIRRATTDQNGYYSFENLAEGYYVVEFDISDLQKQNDGGYTYQYDFTSVQSDDEISGTDSDARNNVDADGRIRRTNVIALTESALQADGIYDHKDMRWDAGLVVYSAIGGFVFDDQDYDDLQSVLIPLEGTVVELYEVHADGSLSDVPVASQVVGADGEYYFDHLVFGTQYKDYSVKFIYPEGYYGVEANADGDGAATEPSSDSDKDSDVNRFDRDPEGDGVDRSQGYIRRIRLYQDMVTTTWDAGARRYSTIGDYVWFDNDKDGIQGEDEEPVAGVIVVLQSRQDKDSEWIYETYTTTDENGYYQFDELASSSYITKEYRVVFALSEDTQITVLNAGNNSAADSDAIGNYMSNIIPLVAPGQTHEGGYVTTYIKPEYGETDLTWDAGVVLVYGAVGDYVWYDDDHDGIQSEGEAGVPNVSVILEMNTSGNSRDENGWVVVGETTTDENGHYIFEGLDSGYYRVKFRIPDDYVNTRYNRGTGENGNEVDSDASRDVGDGWYYSSIFYLAQGQRDMTWDAGIYKPRTHTEVIIDRRPIDRVTIDRVTQTRRIPRTIRTVRSVRTGDDRHPMIYFGTAVVSLGVILTILILRRKKGDKNA